VNRRRIRFRDAPRAVRIAFVVLAFGIAYALILWAPWPWEH
jgi:hypothetical protein